MPAISMFYGIIINMYFNDSQRHHLPHIHVKYSGQDAVISLTDKKLLEGKIPAKTFNLVKAWIDIHYDELLANWELASNNQETYKIDPLK